MYSSERWMLNQIIETDLKTNHSITTNISEKQNRFSFYPYKKYKLDLNAKSSHFIWNFYFDLPIITDHFKLCIQILDNQFNGTIDFSANVSPFR